MNMNSEMHQAGHLTALGWMTFALYMVAALLSLRVAVVSRTNNMAATSRIWIWIAAVLTLLGLNKKLDLQTLLIESGRYVARNGHLTAYRLELYVFFFLIFMSAIIALIVLLIIRIPCQIAKFGRQQPLAAGGCALICTYIIIRAASIVHVDLMMGLDLKRIPFLWLLEASGLILIIAQALCNPYPRE